MTLLYLAGASWSHVGPVSDLASARKPGTLRDALFQIKPSLRLCVASPMLSVGESERYRAWSSTAVWYLPSTFEDPSGLATCFRQASLTV